MSPYFLIWYLRKENENNNKKMKTKIQKFLNVFIFKINVRCTYYHNEVTLHVQAIIRIKHWPKYIIW